MSSRMFQDLGLCIVRLAMPHKGPIYLDQIRAFVDVVVVNFSLLTCCESRC